MSQPLKVFISYSHKDENYLSDFQIHSASLKREKLIENWTDKAIIPGQNWDQSIKRNLKEADLIIFLISPDFIASDYIHGVEISGALKRYSNGEVVIIPIVIRPCDFSSLELSKLQALPKNLEPVSQWNDKDEAWVGVVRELRVVVQELVNEKSNSSKNSNAKDRSVTNSNNSFISNQTLPNNTNNNLSTTASKLKKIISKGKIEAAIDEMLDLTESLDSDLYNSVVLISSRYNSNKRNNNLGIVSREELGIQEARIRTSLLSLIDDLENDFS